MRRTTGVKEITPMGTMRGQLISCLKATSDTSNILELERIGKARVVKRPQGVVRGFAQDGRDEHATDSQERRHVDKTHVKFAVQFGHNQKEHVDPDKAELPNGEEGQALSAAFYMAREEAGEGDEQMPEQKGEHDSGPGVHIGGD